MTTSGECNYRLDPRRLVRDGTSQDDRPPVALDPAGSPIDEHGPSHKIVFASAYSAYLQYFDEQDVPAGDWQRFFDSDVSAQLAVAAIADVSEYRSTVNGLVHILTSRTPAAPEAALTDALGSLFGALGSLARALDVLKETLPQGHPLRGALVNLIRAQLGPGMERLIGYYKAGQALVVIDEAVPSPPIRILGRPVATFSAVTDHGLSPDWFATSGAATWADYYQGVAAAPAGYGPAPAPVTQLVNHLATHYLFSSVLNVFLHGYARAVTEAGAALEATFELPNHQPHYALFLASVRLLEHARASANTLTGKHLDFYYREVLRLRERPSAPGHAHLLIDLAKQVDSHLLAAGTRFKAGKDGRGSDAFFAADRDLAANKAQVVARKSVYRHHNVVDDTLPFQDGRLFAAAVADSDDGIGAPLTSPDGSWHPFFNKVFADGSLKAIRMLPADVGFAIASHDLWLAEGTRTITIDIATAAKGPATDLTSDVTCLLTTEKGWLETKATTFARIADGRLRLTIVLTGEAPPITPYVAATHAYSFDTDLPMLIVKLRHRLDAPWPYPLVEDVLITKVEVHVGVTGLRTLAVSNDFGPVDASKSFQPYGPAPVAGNALIVGSKEVFQKHLTDADVDLEWMTKPSGYKTSPQVHVDVLNAGRWEDVPVAPVTASEQSYQVVGGTGLPGVDTPDLTPDEPYGTASRRGFVRFRLDSDFGQDEYAADLVSSTVADLVSLFSGESPDGEPGTPPKIPMARAMALNYKAQQTIPLDPGSDPTLNVGHGRFFHVTPFGYVEQRPPTGGPRTVTLFPRCLADDGTRADAELYLGIAGLRPPQNLALLAQVVDGTANPLTVKPAAHVQWSYLRENQWIPFQPNTVGDGTDGLLESGIVTLAVPRDASDANTLLPGGQHWLRAVVHTASDAVCRLVLVAAGALQATFQDEHNDRAFPATALAPATISKLAQPDAAIKGVKQPFPSFGGRGAESAAAFATRVSERLRHKDRAIALWDYERLVLEAFPSLYRVRCLNHTRYEPNSAGTGVYRELAPGHVTVVTIPIQHAADRRDPLRPFTSMGELSRIKQFLVKRLCCFATVHVRNPMFEEVYVDFRVRLREGYDEAFHLNRLREELTGFLSPWGFTDEAAPTFTGTFQKSILVDFVEERTYVDYVTDFRLYHRYLARSGTGDLTEVVSPDSDTVAGSCAIAILVSVPATEHVITVIHPGEDAVAPKACPCEVTAL